MNPTLYRTAHLDGLSIFYREAGSKHAETILLLHGLPSSSRMFEPLLARLSDRYHLIAPDYPGFGHSEWPDPKKFDYTFDHLAETMNHFTEVLGLSRYILYVQDYGSPVGFRMALQPPERIEALIVQDAVAHNEGLGQTGNRVVPTGLIAPPMRPHCVPISCRSRPRVRDTSETIPMWSATIPTSGPTSFISESARASRDTKRSFLRLPNVDSYPKWQQWMRESQPRLLVIWGKYETSFDPSEPESYRKDVPNAEVHTVDGGGSYRRTGAKPTSQYLLGRDTRNRADASPSMAFPKVTEWHDFSSVLAKGNEGA